MLFNHSRKAFCGHCGGYLKRFYDNHYFCLLKYDMTLVKSSDCNEAVNVFHGEGKRTSLVSSVTFLLQQALSIIKKEVP